MTQLINGGAEIKYQIESSEGNCDSNVIFTLKILSWGPGLTMAIVYVLTPAIQYVLYKLSVTVLTHSALVCPKG